MVAGCRALTARTAHHLWGRGRRASVIGVDDHPLRDRSDRQNVCGHHDHTKRADGYRAVACYACDINKRLKSVTAVRLVRAEPRAACRVPRARSRTSVSQSSKPSSTRSPMLGASSRVSAGRYYWLAMECGVSCHAFLAVRGGTWAYRAARAAYASHRPARETRLSRRIGKNGVTVMRRLGREQLRYDLQGVGTP